MTLLETVCKLFRATPDPLSKEKYVARLRSKRPNPKVIDMRVRGWGHNIAQCGDSWAIWCYPRPENGDLLRAEEGWFVFDEVSHCSDPQDMSFFVCYKTTAPDLETRKV